jgi:hypothetical protein
MIFYQLTKYTFQNMAINLAKTQMCSFYEKGHCTRGLNCMFAHQKSQLQQCPYEKKYGFCYQNKSGNCQCQLHFVKPGQKATCQFGSNCWHIDNAEHCENFDHVLPEKEDIPEVKKDRCPYGKDCYNGNPNHVETHTHPEGWKPCDALDADDCKDLSCQWHKIHGDVEYVHEDEKLQDEEEEQEEKDNFPALSPNSLDNKEKPVKSKTWAHVAQKKDEPTVSDGKKEDDFPALPVNGVVAEKKPTKNKKVSVQDVLEALICENEDLIMEMIAKRIAKRASAKVVEDPDEALLSKWRAQALANSGKSWADYGSDEE